MIIRVFRATPKAGQGDKLAGLVEQISIPFVDHQPGLISRHTGRGLGRTGEEIVMITVWESLEAMKNMTGEQWEREVIPDEREAELMEETFLYHYQSIP